jgi:hypothetical protein
MAGDGHKHGAEARIGQQRLWECVVRALVTHSRPQCTIKKKYFFRRWVDI